MQADAVQFDAPYRFHAMLQDVVSKIKLCAEGKHAFLTAVGKADDVLFRTLNYYAATMDMGDAASPKGIERLQELEDSANGDRRRTLENYGRVVHGWLAQYEVASPYFSSRKWIVKPNMQRKGGISVFYMQEDVLLIKYSVRPVSRGSGSGGGGSGGGGGGAAAGGGGGAAAGGGGGGGGGVVAMNIKIDDIYTDYLDDVVGDIFDDDTPRPTRRLRDEAQPPDTPAKEPSPQFVPTTEYRKAQGYQPKASNLKTWLTSEAMTRLQLEKLEELQGGSLDIAALTKLAILNKHDNKYYLKQHPSVYSIMWVAVYFGIHLVPEDHNFSVSLVDGSSVTHDRGKHYVGISFYDEKMNSLSTQFDMWKTDKVEYIPFLENKTHWVWRKVPAAPGPSPAKKPTPDFPKQPQYDTWLRL